MGTGTFERVTEFNDWQKEQKKAGSEKEQIGKMPEAHKAVLALLCKDREKWFTRREVCEARGVGWVDRGHTPEARQIWNSLKALVRDGFAVSKRDGQEATYKAAGVGDATSTPADETSHGTQLMEPLEPVEPSSHTNGFRGTSQMEPLEPSTGTIDLGTEAAGDGSSGSIAMEPPDHLQPLDGSTGSTGSTPTPTPTRLLTVSDRVAAALTAGMTVPESILIWDRERHGSALQATEIKRALKRLQQGEVAS